MFIKAENKIIETPVKWQFYRPYIYVCRVTKNNIENGLGDLDVIMPNFIAINYPQILNMRKMKNCLMALF